MAAKKVDDIHGNIAKNLNTMDGNSDGICDICGLPVDQHPCLEHQQAVMLKQLDAVVTEQDELWSPLLGVDSSLPREGQF